MLPSRFHGSAARALRWAGEAMRVSPPFTAVAVVYLICLMLYSSTLPPSVVAAQARSRLERYWLLSVASYFACGCAQR